MVQDVIQPQQADVQLLVVQPAIVINAVIAQALRLWQLAAVTQCTGFSSCYAKPQAEQWPPGLNPGHRGNPHSMLVSSAAADE
jgi:hypothetical protein